MRRVNAGFAGLSRDTDEQISFEQIECAQTIVVMEAGQNKKLTAAYGPQLAGKKVIVLGVPDKFTYMQPELVALLRPKLRRMLNLPL